MLESPPWWKLRGTEGWSNASCPPLGVKSPRSCGWWTRWRPQDYVERSVHNGDRRTKVVRARPAATFVLDRARAITADVQKELFVGHRSPAIWGAARGVLDHLIRKLDRPER